MNEDLTWKFIIGVILLACSARSIMESRRSSPPLNLKTDECWYVWIVVIMTRMTVVMMEHIHSTYTCEHRRQAMGERGNRLTCCSSDDLLTRG